MAGIASSPLAQPTIPYHWADTTKRQMDYATLNRWYPTLVERLSAALNSFHGKTYPSRYWEIVLGPWTLTHLSVTFDRWETVRLLRAAYPEFSTCGKVPSRRRTPRSYGEYVRAAAYSDDFNHNFFSSIIAAQSMDTVSPAATTVPGPIKGSPESGPTIGRLAKLRRLLTRLAYRSGVVRPKVVFIDSRFPAAFLGRLQLQIHELPVLQPDFLLPAPSPSEAEVRSTRAQFGNLLEGLRVESEPDWFAYALSSAADWMPTTALESWPYLRRVNGTIPKSAQRVITSLAHWDNEPFKVWAAEGVSKGRTLVICEHGGSLPLRDHLFDWQERIADAFVPSFGIYHPKHVYARLPKYVDKDRTTSMQPGGGSQRRLGQRLLIVPYYGTTFSIRADSQPQSMEWVRSSDQIVKFAGCLNEAPRQALLIKVLPNDTTAQVPPVLAHLSGRLSGSLEFTETPLESAIGDARLVVCTYPQSTFAEAMFSGVPTILLFDAEVFVSQGVCDSVIQDLQSARVVFFDPAEAARHTNAVWHDLDEWWSADETKRARQRLLTHLLAGDMSAIEQWKTLIMAL